MSIKRPTYLIAFDFCCSLNTARIANVINKLFARIPSPYAGKQSEVFRIVTGIRCPTYQYTQFAYR